MIGKITPKGRIRPLPEENHSAPSSARPGNVKDASLKAPPVAQGVSSSAQTCSSEPQRNQRAPTPPPKPTKEYESVRPSSRDILVKQAPYLTGRENLQRCQRLPRSRHRGQREPNLPPAHSRTSTTTHESLSIWTCRRSQGNDLIRATISNYIRKSKKSTQNSTPPEIRHINRRRTLSGIIQMAKVTSPRSARISVGDKMAGRHGNKGDVSRIVARKTCPSSPTVLRSTSAPQPRWACIAYEPRTDFEAVLGCATRTRREIRYPDFRRRLARPDQRLDR